MNFVPTLITAVSSKFTFKNSRLILLAGALALHSQQFVAAVNDQVVSAGFGHWKADYAAFLRVVSDGFCDCYVATLSRVHLWMV